MTVRLALTGACLAVGALVGCSRTPDPGDLAGWNVLLVTIDTLRADRLGYTGWTAASTPALDELAASGVIFEDAVASAPVTLPAHATILTGLYPPAHGSLNNGRYPLPPDVPTLAGMLRERGYETGAVVASFMLHRKYGLARDFDDYDDRFRALRSKDVVHLERPAEVVTDRALDWLRGRSGESPFFLWVHYYDPHAPYEAPPPFGARFATSPYDGEIAYTDQEVGRLLAGLGEIGANERTLVVFTADHGEALGDGGEKTHGILLRDSTLRVPLVLAAPGMLPSGRRVSGVVSQADIVPTVLELVGGSAPPDLDGESLLGMIGTGVTEERWAYSLTYLPRDGYGWSDLSGVRSDEWAWVRGPVPELYDIGADPGETDNVHDLHPEVVASMESYLRAVESRSRAAAAQPLDPEDEEALRSLGYAMSKNMPESSGADPKTMLPLWNRTNELREALRAGRFEEVAREAPGLLRQDPGNSSLMFFLGQAQVELGQVEEGLALLRRTFEITGSRVQTGTILAMTLAQVGQVDEARQLLESFVRADPDYAGHAYNLGVLRASLGDDLGAIEAYEQALEIHPESIATLANLASARMRSGQDLDRALELIDRAVELSEEDDRPRLFRVQILDALGRDAEAMAAARELAARPRLEGITRTEVADAIRDLQSER